MDIERVLDLKCEIGEAPIWHPGEDVLYFVDVSKGHLHRYDPVMGDHKIVREGQTIGGVTIQRDGSLLLFEPGGSVTVWDQGDERTVLDALPEEADSRFNDVVADPKGRVFAGSIPPDGRLYRIERNARVRSLVEHVDIANGMDFTPNHRGLYFAESAAQIIWRFDYDIETGDISNRQQFVSTIGTPGNPDGLAVDAEGYVWSARWNGGCLLRHDPADGSIDTRVDFPARKVSAITFGGPQFSEAFVTTATTDNNRQIEGDGAGSLFRFTPNVGGSSQFRSDIDQRRPKL